MRATVAAVMMIGALAAPASAQSRGPSGSQGIPPGHMPPPGSCRVWYDGVPPGRQPDPTSCQEAERQASRSRDARVIYGSGIYGNDRYGNGRYGTGPRAIPRSPADVRRAPSGYGRWGGANGAASIPFGNGYEDGYQKGRDDAEDRRRYEPQRHDRYRDGDRGYTNRYGWTRDEYREVYREGFLSGYQEAFRDEGYRTGDDSWFRRR
ncbi:MAG: hypothetical protein AB7F99_04590 [Vicinamibacterales bacterium]